MSPNEEDHEYWISRKIKVTEEFHELRKIRNWKQEELEEQKRIHDENMKKIEELKQKIEELKEQINDNRPGAILRSRSKESPMNSSAPVFQFKRFQRQETKEFDNPAIDEAKLEENIDKLFEYFFVLGSLPGNNEPQTIYCFPENNNFAESPQGRFLGNFAFPEGIKTTEVNQKKVLQHLLEIYNTDLNRNGKHFVFSVKSDVEKVPAKSRERAKYKRELLYCVCVVVEDLTDVDQRIYYFQPRCYCLLSYFPCFELLFKLLFWMVRLKFEAEKKILGHNFDDDFYRLQRALQNLITRNKYDEISEALLYFADKKVDSLEIRYGTFNYTFVASHKDLDILWFCPLMFSLLDFEDFFYLLFAILQEASVIFLSKNMDYLSSCVLGFQGLIRPYYWPHMLTPILPLTFLDILEAPMPLLAGIPSSSELSLKKKLSHLIIVDLDNKHIENRIRKPLASSAKLLLPRVSKRRLREGYSCFNKGPIYKPNKEQVDCSKRISKIISGFIKDQFKKLLDIQATMDSAQLKDVDDIIQVLKQSGEEDLEFKNSFYGTQMCINYIEDFHLHKVGRGRKSID